MIKPRYPWSRYGLRKKADGRFIHAYTMPFPINRFIFTGPDFVIAGLPVNYSNCVTNVYKIFFLSLYR